MQNPFSPERTFSPVLALLSCFRQQSRLRLWLNSLKKIGLGAKRVFFCDCAIYLATHAKSLSKGIEEGYGEKLGQIDYGTPDGNMIRHLLENVYQFSAAKNYTQLRQLTQALVGPDNKLRTYSQFKQEAFKLNDTHVNQWLKAEYELAVAGSQMASIWVDIEKNGATMLEFDAVLDSKTSDGCRLLNGVRKPVNDPFWNTYYPPNHYNCRSTVRQHHDGPTTPDHQITYPDDRKVPPMFRTNLGKQGLIFPPGHPYWMGMDVTALKEGEHLLVDVYHSQAREWLVDGNKEVHRHMLNGPITFNNKGLEEILSKGHKKWMKRNALLPYLDEALKVAGYEGYIPKESMLAKHAQNPMIEKMHIFSFEIEGVKTFAIVRQYRDGNRLYALSDNPKVLTGIKKR